MTILVGGIQTPVFVALQVLIEQLKYEFWMEVSDRVIQSNLY